ncbi:MAG: SMI1/KNR4 family protein [Synechococcaceae cyanobacterium SM2_3_2]|nr:SMI1/KNR4 family protein [Synechococcaceae cyanobacterium SM2_3_2]
MSKLKAVLDRIMSCLERNNSPVAILLRDGLDDEQIDSIDGTSLPYQLPNEIRDFFRWRNGIDEKHPDFSLENQKFLNDWVPLSLEDAAAYIGHESEDYFSDNNVQDSWFIDSRNMLPIFTDFFGEVYLCIKIEGDQLGPIFRIQNDESGEFELAYPDVYTMLLLESVKANMIIFDDSGIPTWT